MERVITWFPDFWIFYDEWPYGNEYCPAFDIFLLCVWYKSECHIWHITYEHGLCCGYIMIGSCDLFNNILQGGFTDKMIVLVPVK